MKRAAKQSAQPSPPPDALGLLHITHAYNRGEITFEQWLEQTRAWAEAVVKHYHGEPDAEDVTQKR